MKTVLSYVICYLLWAISAALVFFELLMVTRGLILRISTVTIERPYARGVWDKFGVLILGLLWLGFAILSEHQYREGVQEGKLYQRFARVTGVQIALLAAVGIPFVLIVPR